MFVPGNDAKGSRTQTMTNTCQTALSTMEPDNDMDIEKQKIAQGRFPRFFIRLNQLVSFP